MSRDFHQEIAKIRVFKNFYNEEPSHWSVEVIDIDGQLMGIATAPSFNGVWDSAYGMLTGRNGDFDDESNPWVEFDANIKGEQK